MYVACMHHVCACECVCALPYAGTVIWSHLQTGFPHYHSYFSDSFIIWHLKLTLRQSQKIIKNLYSIHMWMYACMYECLFVCTYILCMCIYPYVFLTKCELSALPTTTTTNELRARGWLAVNWSAAVATADAMVNEFNEVTSGTRQQLFALPDRQMSFRLPRAINVQ